MFTLNDVVLVVALVPYLIFTVRDNALHSRARKVYWPEHLTHLVVLVGLLVGIGAAFTRDVDRMLIGGALFVPPALIDELLFHRDIPAEEHDVHAKQHLLLFVFIIVAALVIASER